MGIIKRIGSIDVNESIFTRSKKKRKMSDQPSTTASSSHAKQQDHHHHQSQYTNLSTAFKDTPAHKNKSTRLLRQQVWALFVKRARILGRRYVIAVCTLLLPLALEAVLSVVIPSSAVVISDAINSIFGVRTIPPFEFDLYKYGPQTLPVRSNDSTLQARFVDYLDRQAIIHNKPRQTLKYCLYNSLYILMKPQLFIFFVLHIGSLIPTTSTSSCMLSEKPT